MSFQWQKVVVHLGSTWVDLLRNLESWKNLENLLESWTTASLREERLLTGGQGEPDNTQAGNATLPSLFLLYKWTCLNNSVSFLSAKVNDTCFIWRWRNGKILDGLFKKPHRFDDNCSFLSVNLLWVGLNVLKLLRDVWNILTIMYCLGNFFFCFFLEGINFVDFGRGKLLRANKQLQSSQTLRRLCGGSGELSRLLRMAWSSSPKFASA